MKKLPLTLVVLAVFAQLGFTQPMTASSITNGPITVYTDNGYYVKAKNSDVATYVFSFRYETTGYTVSTAAWSKYPVYTPVSTITEEYNNVTINGNEERNLFTAPVDPNKQKEYYIKITEIYKVEKVERRR